MTSMDLFLNMVRGFCMALADSVPGVSGGTIAFVLAFTTNSSVPCMCSPTATGN